MMRLPDRLEQPLLLRLREVGFDYLGISIDGLEETHDRFRRRPGAFRESLRGIRLCRDAGIRVGIRFRILQPAENEGNGKS